MKRTLSINRNLLIYGIRLSLMAVLIFLMKSPLVQANEAISMAITADLLLIVRLVYFLLIRKTEIPNTTVIPVMIIGWKRCAGARLFFLTGTSACLQKLYFFSFFCNEKKGKRSIELEN